VLEVGDGIARIYGLSNAMAGEQLEFANGQFGQVFNLEESSVGVVIFGDYLDIKEGDEVRRTGHLLSIPCGEPLVGRVVDPSILSDVRSTARASSKLLTLGRSSSRHQASPRVSRLTSLCRPASRPSTA
jgi:F0F1-type ATP synthase alpha subunit